MGNHTENETDISDNVAKVELDAGESLKLIQFCVKCHLIREDMGNIWGKNGKYIIIMMMDDAMEINSVFYPGNNFKLIKKCAAKSLISTE